MSWIANSLFGGILGKVGQRIGSWIPDKDQRYREKLKALEKELDDLSNPNRKNSNTPANKRDIDRVNKQLYEIKDYLQTR